MNNTTSLTARLLIAILDFSQSNRSRSVQELSVFLGCSRPRIARSLSHLIDGGLIQTQSHSLSFVGLSLATQLRSERQVNKQEIPTELEQNNDENCAA